MMIKLFRILILMCVVISGGVAQNIAAGPKSPEKPVLTFGVVADVQYCDCDNHGTRYFRESLWKLTEAIQDFNVMAPAFVIQLGDLIDRDFVTFEAVLPIFQQVKAPVYHVLGNHDFWGKSKEKHQILQALGLESGYYDFTYHSWRFIVLDGNDLSFYATAKESEHYPEVEPLFQQITLEGRPNAQKWHGGLSQQQFVWLKERLDKALENKEKLILFCHFPTFPPDMHNLWNDAELVKLLDSYPNVVAYMNGHNHAGNYGERNGIHYLNLQGMVETLDTNAYAIVEVYNDYLNIIGKGRELSRVLHIK